MSSWALLITALALSADAFAVAVGRGTTMAKLDTRSALAVAGVFGICQAGMPLAGWLAGSRAASHLDRVGHWFAFGLLVVVGGKMLLDKVRPVPADVCLSWGLRVLLALGIATSIDALAVGAGLAVVDVDIIRAVALIGTTAFALSYAGVVLGQRAGARHQRLAGLLGGSVLIALGVHILLRGLDIG